MSTLRAVPMTTTSPIAVPPTSRPISQPGTSALRTDTGKRPRAKAPASAQAPPTPIASASERAVTRLGSRTSVPMYSGRLPHTKNSETEPTERAAAEAGTCRAKVVAEVPAWATSMPARIPTRTTWAAATTAVSENSPRRHTSNPATMATGMPTSRAAR